MSRIVGSGTYYEDAIKQPLLLKALTKLAQRIYSTRESHLLARPMANGQDARFMVERDYDLARRWAWRIYNGPIPKGHRIYVGCDERHCVEPTHLIAYKAERLSRQMFKPSVMV